jgi:hypothetical protein
MPTFWKADMETRLDQAPRDSGLAYPKGPTMKRLKGRKARTEAKVKRTVRAACVERDGYCLVQRVPGVFANCKGPSEWAHLAGHRRSQTVGMPATYRHNTAWTAMLCNRHHKLEEDDVFHVIYKTANYADGPVGWEPGASRRLSQEQK